MNVIVQSWRDALLLCLPKNFSLLLLVTINNAIRTYRHLVVYFGWLMVLLIATHQFFLSSFLPYIGISPEMLDHVSHTLQIVVASVWLTAVYLCARPSVLPKSFEYFSQYLFYIPYIICWIALVLWTHTYIFMPLVGRMPIALAVLDWLIWLYAIGVALFFPLFLLDAPISVINAIKAVRRALLMSWYNLPVVLIWAGAFLGACVGSYWVFALLELPEGVSSAWWLVKVLVIVPVMILFFCTLYTKKVHEQFALYF